MAEAPTIKYQTRKVAIDALLEDFEKPEAAPRPRARRVGPGQRAILELTSGGDVYQVKQAPDEQTRDKLWLSIGNFLRNTEIDANVWALKRGDKQIVLWNLDHSDLPAKVKDEAAKRSGQKRGKGVLSKKAG